MKTIEWKGNAVVILDQTLLPHQQRKLVCRTVNDVARAIEKMKIRGAPALAVAAGMGVALAAVKTNTTSKSVLIKQMEAAARRLERTRPTAVNLFVGIRRVLAAARRGRNVSEIKKRAVSEALKIASEDIEINKKIGMHGAKLIPPGATILTHCNAGALATAGYGTALGVIRSAHKSGKKIRVIATETRPLLQGARLTAWELARDGIPVRVVVDSAVGYLMARGEIDVVVVGADRIAANGDTANKIGTYTIAVLARHHGVPFYVAAPLSTIDFSLSTGSDIPIEFRSRAEVEHFAGKKILPRGVGAINPAFDVTPARLITRIITEHGAVEPSKLGKLKFHAPNL